MRWCVLATLATSACGFEGPAGGAGAADAGDDDATGDITADAGDDSDCVIGGIDLCSEDPEPTLGPGVIDTGSDPRCITLAQTNGPDACVIYTESVAIPDAAQLVGVGARPLIIASRGDVIIDGTVDVSSQRNQQRGAGANDSACPEVAGGEGDLGGGGGGAGGSGSAKGGDGGIGDSDSSLGQDGTGGASTAAEPSALPVVVRGGCPGSAGGHGGDSDARPGGRGGNGGGAVALLSLTTISITGGVRATGGGGDGGSTQAGGGGGGSGGYVSLSAPAVINDGMVIATGGGGGGGGVNVNGDPFRGGPGDDAALSLEMASGGSSVIDPEGIGGDSTMIGAASRGGGGGGGGGPGFIAVAGTASGSGVYMPDAVTGTAP